MGEGLSKPDLATRMFLLASIFDLMRERQEVADAHLALKILLGDLQSRLDSTFTLNEEQKVHATSFVRWLLFNKPFKGQHSRCSLRYPV